METQATRLKQFSKQNDSFNFILLNSTLEKATSRIQFLEVSISPFNRVNCFFFQFQI